MTGEPPPVVGQGATLVAWLDRRAEPAPASLHSRLVDAVRATPLGDGDSLLEHSLRTGERLLSRLLEHGCGARADASDLLAADALVTYAFEAASEDASLTPAAMAERAESAMRSIAARGDRA